jgi:hypothetical protein
MRMKSPKIPSSVETRIVSEPRRIGKPASP